MVDMSPEAVTQRLRLMDELWELSLKLMGRKKMSDSESEATEMNGKTPKDGRPWVREIDHE